jgi:hypothetical protein
MKYFVCTITLLFVIVAGALAADAPAGPPPARVVIEQVQEKMVAENTPIVGSLYFDRASCLAPEVAGVVNSVAVGPATGSEKGMFC